MPEIEKVSWIELKRYVDDVHSKNFLWFSKLQDTVKELPFNLTTLDTLVETGWKVNFRDLSSCVGMCLPQFQLLVLKKYLSPYERDKTLFHELAHAVYGLPGFNKEEIYGYQNPFKEYHESLAEFLGRTWRADASLLKKAVLSFSLEPKIYDQTSYLAFRDLDSQLEFPFLKDYYLKTFMD